MIYCVEDDDNIRELVVYSLQTSGLEALGCRDGAELDRAMAKTLPELILLDIMLPDEDGISILKRLRKSSATGTLPIILMTAKGAEYDKVLGLNLGADDYIAKPFGIMELIARIKALLRRAGLNQDQDQLTCGEIALNKGRHSVTAGGKKLNLTLKEFELLKLLMSHRGQVFSREVLLDKIWGYDFGGETRTVDVHIASLRSKLGQAGEMIETIRGVGYRLEA
ncbi:MAG: response regulator transcription factor [Candidatus Riflebacteria bacterium]|nr:response regulator transcription factor [Candidatus Riflebacteria bacterium]